MKMVVGLGNPGKKYQATKHNIGFITLDELAYQQKISFNQSKFEADIAEGRFNNEKVLFVKPQTYMNDSGRSVRPLMDYYNVDAADLLVIYDDLDLPVGKVRLRQKGSAGGHNGIKSIIQHIGTQDFNRIRIGIDRPFPKQTVVQHVLSPFAKNVYDDMLDAVKRSAAATTDWLEGSTFIDTMNTFN